MDKFLKRTADTEQDIVPSTSNVEKKNLSKGNTGKIKSNMDFLAVVMEMLQNQSRFFGGSNFQMKQCFRVNLCAT